MTAENFRACAVLPVYNHPAVLERTVDDLLGSGLPVVLVDDGSDALCRALMDTIAAGRGQVHLVRRPANGGKGAAVKDGLRAALALGFSHALQIDADGQHDTVDVEPFIGIARRRPRALVAGYPAYDASVPRHRYYARYATHVWVWINTLSTRIRDAMCGFRVYPLAEACALLDRHPMGSRMEFDVEFIVRWQWAGLPLEQRQTRVTYPEDGISHFRLWRDNVLISGTHARLFLTMLTRLPTLLARRLRRPGNAP
ncbi:MAG: glycosyltransferase family 2 protein [Porticoccaceae bacterium]